MQSQVEEFARRSSPDIHMSSQDEGEAEEKIMRREEEEEEENNIAVSLTPAQQKAGKASVGVVYHGYLRQ